MPEETKTENLSTTMTGATRSAETARALIRKTKRVTRRRFPPEDKIRIVIEGVRGEISVAELCRREGIHPTIYYKWLKDFMEAGKARMRGDTMREATSDEVKASRRENERLKQLVADLSVANLLLKKKPELGLIERRRYERVSADKKRELIELVRRSPQPKRTTIAELGLSRSTFYRWQRRYREHGEAGLVDHKPDPGAVWNRLRPAEKTVIVETALQQPDLSPRELACHLTVHAGFTVSEATIYRVLKQYGLNRTIPLVGFPASKEFRVKTTGRNQLWQSDASYFFVGGWGWYYSIEVLDDFSRFVLASDLKPDMTVADGLVIAAMVVVVDELLHGACNARFRSGCATI